MSVEAVRTWRVGESYQGRTPCPGRGGHCPGKKRVISGPRKGPGRLQAFCADCGWSGFVVRGRILHASDPLSPEVYEETMRRHEAAWPGRFRLLVLLLLLCAALLAAAFALQSPLSPVNNQPQDTAHGP